jgi:hypothetical protein
MNTILAKDWQSCNSSAMAKKRFGQRTQGETTNTRKRAAARIALTCLIGQWRHGGVRIFYGKLWHRHSADEGHGLGMYSANGAILILDGMGCRGGG